MYTQGWHNYSVRWSSSISRYSLSQHRQRRIRPDTEATSLLTDASKHASPHIYSSNLWSRQIETESFVNTTDIRAYLSPSGTQTSSEGGQSPPRMTKSGSSLTYHNYSATRSTSYASHQQHGRQLLIYSSRNDSLISCRQQSETSLLSHQTTLSAWANCNSNKLLKQQGQKALTPLSTWKKTRLILMLTNTHCFNRLILRHCRTSSASLQQSTQASDKRKNHIPTIEVIGEVDGDKTSDAETVEAFADEVATASAGAEAEANGTEMITGTRETGATTATKTNDKTRQHSTGGRQDNTHTHRLLLTTTLAIMAACLTGGGTMGARWSSPALAMPAKTGQEKTEAAQQARRAVPGQGGGEDAGGGGNSPIAAQRSGAEFDLHGTEERQRQAQAGDKFAVGEQSPPQNSLQNEYDAGCQGGDHPGMLHGESGSQGLLLGSSSGGRRPEGLSFPLERDQLCLQVPSLWSSPFSTIYNQAIQARGGIPPRERAQSNHIYRRYADTRRLSGTMQRVSPSGERSFQGSRRDYKRRKVVVSPGTDDRVLRLLYRLAYDDADGAGEQDQEPQESYSSFVTPPRRISPGAGCWAS